MTSERMQAALAKVNHQLLSFFEAKNFFSIFFKSNGPVLIRYANGGKTKDHNYIVSSLLSRKYGNKEDQQVQKVETNDRAYIHSDVINYLTEEGINIMAHPPYLSDRCTMPLLAK